MKRRMLIRGFGSVALLSLTACPRQTPGPNPGPVITVAQVITDMENMVAALSTGFNNVVKLQPNLIPASTQKIINDALGEANALLATLMGATNTNDQAVTVQQIEGYINAIIAAAASVPLIPVPFSTALGAAAVLLPIIEIWINSVLPQKMTVVGNTVAARAKFAPQNMSQSQAEDALAKLAGP